MSITDRETQDFAARRAHIDAADAFLTALSQGKDPSKGKDELASLLLGMKNEVEAGLEPMPVSRDRSARSRRGAQRLGDGRSAAVTHLAVHRASRHPRQRLSVLWGGAVGAVAASAVIIGAGSAIYHANPGETLWGAHVAIFGEPETSLVQLASTFSEVEKRASNGDVEGAQRLIEEARELIDRLDQRDREIAQRQLEDAQRSVVQTKTVAPPTTTITTTETATEVVTITSLPTETEEPEELENPAEQFTPKGPEPFPLPGTRLLPGDRARGGLPLLNPDQAIPRHGTTMDLRDANSDPDAPDDRTVAEGGTGTPQQ